MQTARPVEIVRWMAIGMLLAAAACSSTRRLDMIADAGADHVGSGCAPASQIYCTRGAPVSPGGPVACSDALEFGICVGGAWTCPAGTALNINCNCNGGPPIGCNVCTFNGWKCNDAGAPDTVYPDAGQHDTGPPDTVHTDTGGQCPSPNPGASCVGGAGSAGSVVCDDVAYPPICGADGGWTCGAGKIPTNSCNCFYPPVACSNCIGGLFPCNATCGTHGWICPSPPDAGPPDAASADAGTHG